jgi:hypothetical protein
MPSPDAPKRRAPEAHLSSKVGDDIHAVVLHTIHLRQRILQVHGPSCSRALHSTDGSRPVMLSQNTIFGMDSGSNLVGSWSRRSVMPRDQCLFRQSTQEEALRVSWEMPKDTSIP